ncbi:MAG: alpha/beta hydrolase [Acidimicrobiia bacterium]
MRAALTLVVATGLAPAGVACTDDDGGSNSSSSADEQPADAEKVAGSRLPGPGAFMGPVFKVPVNGIEIGYRQFGDGDDLVLIMGDTGAMSLWLTSFPRKLAAHFRVTMFDNRGVGYTTDDTSVPLTVPLMARDTAEFITALELEKPAVLGWSMGGEIGLTMAVEHPDAMRALVTTGGDFGSSRAVQPSMEVFTELNAPSTTPEDLLALIFPNNAPGQAASGRFVDEYESIPQEMESEKTDRRQGKAETEFVSYRGTYERLPDVTIPVLVTNGAIDIVNPRRTPT